MQVKIKCLKMQIVHALFTEEVILFFLIVFVSIFVHANQGSRLHIINPRKETTRGLYSQSINFYF